GDVQVDPGPGREWPMRTSNHGRGRLLAAVLLLSSCGLFAATAAAAPPDPVEELRLLLKATVTDPDARNKAVGEQLKLLDGISDLRKALVLREWRDDDPDEQASRVDRSNRAEVARRFEQAVRDVLQG